MQKAQNIYHQITSLSERHLNFEQWGFRESARIETRNSPPSVIYSSELCKIKIAFNEWHPPHQSQDYSIDIYYGKLTAPNNREILVLDSEECYCWHGIVKVLHFIDKATPEYAAKNLFSHKLVKQFRGILSYKDLPHKLPEWEIRKHAFIWKQYAPRLFEAFDLKHPDLWEQYRKFLKDVYDIRGRSSLIDPPMDKVC